MNIFISVLFVYEEPAPKQKDIQVNGRYRSG